MNKLKIIVTSFLIISTTSLISCKKDDKKSSGGAESCTNNGYLKFLKIGNKWTYSYIDLFSEDTAMTMEIKSLTSGNAYQFALTGGGTFVSGAPSRYMRECNDWLLVNSTTDPIATKDKTYPLARKVGDKWTVGTSNNYEVLAVGVPVTTEAGTFTCDKFSYNQLGSFNVDTVYFSNEIGYVKYVGLLLEYSLKSKNF